MINVKLMYSSSTWSVGPTNDPFFLFFFLVKARGQVAEVHYLWQDRTGGLLKTNRRLSSGHGYS